MTTSITGADLGGTNRLDKRLAVLPMAAGALAIAVLFVGTGTAGLTTDASEAPLLTMLGALSVAVTIAIGNPIGLYVGLALVVIASRTVETAISSPRLAILAVTLLAVHEATRFSLDARRPTRFGPGFLRRFAVQLVVIATLLVGIVAGSVVIEGLDLPIGLFPLGLAAVAVPLFLRPSIAALGPRLSGGRTAVLLAVVIAIVALGLVALGAQARTGVESTTPGESEEVEPEVELAPRPESVLPGLGNKTFEREVVLAMFALALIIIGLLYAALRRPEVTLILDDLDLDLDDSSLSLISPRQAEIEDRSAKMTTAAAVDLLDDLILDIAEEPDPGRAIRYGFANVERRLKERGLVRGEAETEHEFMDRSLPMLGSHGPTMIALTSLFERARFSSEPLDESMRETAIAAVTELRDATAQDDPDPSEDIS